MSKLKSYVFVMFFLFATTGTAFTEDLGECLSSMQPLVTTKIKGDQVIVTMSRDVPNHKYESYYKNSIALFCACERIWKPGCLKNINEIIVQNYWGKLGRVFEVGNGGREVCQKVSYPLTDEDTKNILFKTHMK